MLQQTTIKVVSAKYIEFIKKFPNILSVANADVQQIKLAVSGLGYYRRFSYFHAAATLLVKNRGSEINYPQNYKDWKALPGVGEYTSRAIASICQGEKVGIVDGNVERVFARMKGVQDPLGSSKLKGKAQEFMDIMSCEGSSSALNQGVMELGQLICISGKPRCENCPVQKTCYAFKNNLQSQLPTPKIRKKANDIELWLMLKVGPNNELCLQTRDNSQKFLKGVLGFPTFYDVEALKSSYPTSQLLGEFKHSIMQYKIKVHVFHSGSNPMEISDPKIAEKLISNLDHKALKILNKKEADQQRSASQYITRVKRGEEGVKLDSRLIIINPRLISKENQARGASL